MYRSVFLFNTQSAEMENASLIALKKCEVSNETVAERLKFSTDFIIDQKLVQIDGASKFDNGAFGKVIRASYVGAEVRVKRFHAILCSSGEGAVRLDLHRFFQECRLAQTLRHPNIVHFYGVVMDGNLPMLVMEALVCTLYDLIEDPEKYAAAKDIFEAPHAQLRSVTIDDTQKHTVESADSTTATETASIVVPDQETTLINCNASASDRSKIPEEAVKSKPIIHNTIKGAHKTTLALNIAQGLQYLHTKKPYPIVHRDLSSRNILLRTDSHKFVAKIGDFGQSKEIKHRSDWSSTNPGTLEYLPPEVHSPPDSGQEFFESRVLVTTNQSLPQETEIEGQIGPADQLPEALEPDDVRTATVRQSSSRPLLKPSIDMYMYGVLMIELASQQIPPKWRRYDCKDSWFKTHRDTIESLNKESILCQVATKCILEVPDERLGADQVVEMIKSTFPRSPSAGAFNEVSAR